MSSLLKKSCAGLMAVAVSGAAWAAPLSFTGIGTVAGSVGSRASAISADGQVVGATATTAGGNPSAFLYLVGTGQRTVIGDGATSVLALSSNGGRAVGVAGTRGFTFDRPAGPVMKPYSVSSSISGVSANGLVTAGWYEGFGAFRRTEGEDPFSLETLSGYSDMFVSGCSGDGGVVIGTASRYEPGDPDLGTPDRFYYEAAKVVGDGAWVGLGTLDGTINPPESYANGVSANGLTVVGTSLVSRAIPDSADIAYIYTAFKHQGGSMTPLLSLAGELGFSEALDATADGAIVVGSGDGGSSATGSSATMWVGGAPQDVKGMIVGLLNAAGRSTAAIDNWSLTSCTAIADDGAWIAGEGLFMGVAQGWVARLVEEPAFAVNPPAVVAVNLGGTLALSVTASGTPPPTYQWYTGQPGSGTPLSDNGGTVMGAGTSLLLIHGIQPSDAGSTYYCVATNSLGTATSTVATLAVNVPPQFTSGLPPTTGAVAGGAVTLSVSAVGTPDPTFQWYKGAPGSGTPISDSPGSVSGATTASLTLTNVQAGAAGDYYCVATNEVSSATSNSTTLSIIVPPAITMNPPAKVIVHSGDNAQFGVSASGSPAPMYAWSKGAPGSGVNLMDDGSSISGAQTPTLTLTGVTPDAAGTYYCTAYIFEGYFANSTASQLIVNTGPVITQQPFSLGPPPGYTISLLVAIDGTLLGGDSVTYQWMRDGTPIDFMTNPRFSVDHTSGNFADSTLTIADLAAGDAGVYSVLITGPTGTSLSNDATLSVVPFVPAHITSHPAPLQRKVVGDTVTFSVTAEGYPTPTYQWYKGPPSPPLADGPTPWGSVISGATSPTLTITGISEKARPNTPLHAITQLPGIPSTGSPSGTVLLNLDPVVQGSDTLYVLDDGGDPMVQSGVYKYAYDTSISQWVLVGDYPLAPGASGLSARLLEPDAFGPGSPPEPVVLLSLTLNGGDAVAIAIDSAVYGTGMDMFSIVDGASAPTGTKYRGTALAALPTDTVPILALLASRVGDGVNPLSDTGSPVLLEAFAFGPGFGGTVPLPSSGPGTKLILDGTSLREGQLTLSPDGEYLVMTGYDTEPGGMTPLADTGSADVRRSVAIVPLIGPGAMVISPALGDFADHGHPHAGVTDDGINLWLAGSTGGLRYTTIGSDSSVPVSAAGPDSLRTVAIFDSQLHVTSGGETILRGGAGTIPPPDPSPLRVGSVDPAPPFGNDFDSYICVVHNLSTFDLSNPGVLENAANPKIAQQPQNAAAASGTAATFTVTLDSAEIGTDSVYTWLFAGVLVDPASDPRFTIDPVSGTTGTCTLTINSVTDTDAGEYEVLVRHSAGGNTTRSTIAMLTVAPANPCRLDYTPDGVANSDDLGDFITDYFTDPPVPGPDGYATACPDNDPPYDLGYKAAFTLDGSPQCFQPNSDNLGDFITAYFDINNGCGNNGP